MPNNTIRIGLVGAGANTTLRHIPGFKAIPNVEIISVANRTRESGQHVADKHQIPKVYDNWDELISAPDTDAICIGTWPYMHHTIVLSALLHDKHVLTEARMAMNASEAHTMLEASRQKPNLVTQIVPAPHTLKIDSTIKNLISEGFLGDLLSVDLAVHQGGFVDYDAPLHWRNNSDFSGYNTMQMGIWYEALMRWIGPASSVSSMTRVHVKNRRDDNGKHQVITIPDHVEILCEMACGPILHMRFSSITGLSSEDRVWIFGTEGTLRLDAETMTLYGGRRGDDQLSKIEIPIKNQSDWRVEEEFINAIRGNETVTHTTFEIGVKYMEFTEAVLRSAQSGKIVHLPL